MITRYHNPHKTHDHGSCNLRLSGDDRQIFLDNQSWKSSRLSMAYQDIGPTINLQQFDERN